MDLFKIILVKIKKCFDFISNNTIFALQHQIFIMLILGLTVLVTVAFAIGLLVQSKVENR